MITQLGNSDSSCLWIVVLKDPKHFLFTLWKRTCKCKYHMNMFSLNLSSPPDTENITSKDWCNTWMILYQQTHRFLCCQSLINLLTLLSGLINTYFWDQPFTSKFSSHQPTVYSRLKARKTKRIIQDFAGVQKVRECHWCHWYYKI